jgi:hypothetical protein
VSVNCRIPHLNIDSLRDELHKGNVVGRLGITTGDQLLEWIKAKNKLLSSKSDADWAKAYRWAGWTYVQAGRLARRDTRSTALGLSLCV